LEDGSNSIRLVDRGLENIEHAPNREVAAGSVALNQLEPVSKSKIKIGQSAEQEDLKFQAREMKSGHQSPRTRHAFHVAGPFAAEAGVFAKPIRFFRASLACRAVVVREETLYRAIG